MRREKNLRKVWRAMHARCESPSDPSYKNYGLRGIRVDPRWESFDTFLADMGLPGDGMTLERVDNDGNYSPENCRWATRAEQSRNRRGNLLLTLNGRTQCLADWANELGMGESFIRRRMRVQGMSFEEAVTKPKRYAVWRKNRNPADRMEQQRGIHRG